MAHYVNVKVLMGDDSLMVIDYLIGLYLLSIIILITWMLALQATKNSSRLSSLLNSTDLLAIIMTQIS